MDEPAQLPKQFSDLSRFIDWAQPTTATRVEKRRTASAAQRREFYTAVLPTLDEMLQYLNAFPLHEMPADARTLSYLALSMAEVALYVEWFDGELSPVAGESEAALKLVQEPSR